MNKRNAELIARRAALRSRAGIERHELARQVDDLDARLHAIDSKVLRLRSFVTRPAVLGGAAVLALTLGRKRLPRLLGKGFMLATTARKILGFIKSVRG